MFCIHCSFPRVTGKCRDATAGLGLPMHRFEAARCGALTCFTVLDRAVVERSVDVGGPAGAVAFESQAAPSSTLKSRTRGRQRFCPSRIWNPIALVHSPSRLLKIDRALPFVPGAIPGADGLESHSQALQPAPPGGCPGRTPALSTLQSGQLQVCRATALGRLPPLVSRKVALPCSSCCWVIPMPAS